MLTFLLCPVLSPQPWLLSFPEISSDSRCAYFSGPVWTAIYEPQSDTLYVVSRDSLVARGALPSPSASGEVRVSNGTFYVAAGALYFGERVVALPPALRGCVPVWVGAARDSLYVLLERGEGNGQTVLTALDPVTHALREVDFSSTPLQDEGVRAIAAWHDVLLLATDRSVAVWKPGQRVRVWQSRHYAATDTRWLYAKTFPEEAANPNDGLRLLPLKSRTPLEVRAQFGSWLEVVSPIALEGFVEASDWEKHGVLWSQRRWHCAGKPCFARVRVLQKGRIVETDLTDVPLTYLARTREGVKVSFQAAWARVEDLVPVMVRL